MKFDPEKARQILLEMEKSETDWCPLNMSVPSMADQDFWFHTRLLADGGFIEAYPLTNTNSINGNRYHPKMLTYKGVQFIEMFSRDDHWLATTRKVGSKMGGMTLEMLMIAAESWVKQTLA